MAYIDTLRFFCGWVVKLIKPIKIVGEKKLKNKKVIYCINHQSTWDAPLFLANFKVSPVCLYKSEYREKPFYRKLFDKLGYISVSRGENDISAIKKSLEVLKSGKSLLICPEGTRSRTGEMLPFKEGAVSLAIRTKTPIRPVYLSYPFARGKKRGKVYVVVGDEFELDELYTIKPSAEDLQKANFILEQRMLQLKENLMALLAEKKK